MIINNLYQVP